MIPTLEELRASAREYFECGHFCAFPEEGETRSVLIGHYVIPIKEKIPVCECGEALGPMPLTNAFFEIHRPNIFAKDDDILHPSIVKFSVPPLASI